jgi:peptidoglycan/LPS O-acetylase OafA/YrhL
MSSRAYRNDIDGLRAIAVMSVIIFHFGFLPNGYLGVDVFFVISGFLITQIIYSEYQADRFSLKNFYLRRIRRIIPLVLFTCLTAIAVGMMVMLPDDLENLGQSVVATNFFANNVLLYITTANYWNVVNEYKPLMHTWSLGVEEQFYMVFPLLFVFCPKKWFKGLFLTIIFLAGLSMVGYLIVDKEAAKFYLVYYRFFEIAAGSIAAILFYSKKVEHPIWTCVGLTAIAGILFFGAREYAQANLLIVVLSSLVLLVNQSDSNLIGKVILSNPISVFVGKISFSLYMWHQIVLAFARYFVFEKITVVVAFSLLLVIFLLSIGSYYLIEQVFRDKNRVSVKRLLVSVGFGFLISSGASFYLYMIGGVVRDVPELSIKKSDTGTNLNFLNLKNNPHALYNSRVYDLDKPFVSQGKVKVLVIGNSFARDWGNVLIESYIKDSIEVSYCFSLSNSSLPKDRVANADIIFFSELPKDALLDTARVYVIDTSKVWNIGTKSFGYNNGIFYNSRGMKDFHLMRTSMAEGFIEKNEKLKKEWSNKYIDMIAKTVDADGKVGVFTPDKKFISQDCTHFTEAGAIYYANLFKGELDFVLNSKPQTSKD